MYISNIDNFLNDFWNDLAPIMNDGVFYVLDGCSFDLYFDSSEASLSYDPSSSSELIEITISHPDDLNIPYLDPNCADDVKDDVFAAWREEIEEAIRVYI